MTYKFVHTTITIDRESWRLPIEVELESDDLRELIDRLEFTNCYGYEDSLTDGLKELLRILKAEGQKT